MGERERISQTTSSKKTFFNKPVVGASSTREKIKVPDGCGLANATKTSWQPLLNDDMRERR